MVACGAAASLIISLGLSVSAAQADTAPADPLDANSEAAFPPRANGVWMYDRDRAGAFDPGRWINLINKYNAAATPGNELGQVFSYGSDMETYCEDDDADKCTLDDLNMYYTPDSVGYESTGAYVDGLDPIDNDPSGAAARPVVMTPVIDGRIGPEGYLRNFNDLSESLARDYADKASKELCADGRIDGIQFDLEPFDVTTPNGQYYFYLQIAKNFAGDHDGDPGNDPYGCVDAAHPQGRFFSFFTFAAAIEPGTVSASNVHDVVTSYGNGLIIASLYDLNNLPAGTLNDLPTYTGSVQQEVANMKAWAQELEIPYAFGIPASASAHEYTTCDGPDCRPGKNGATGYPMLDYTKAAVTALHDSAVDSDPLFRGTSIWDFGEGINVDGNAFQPAPAPAEVLLYLTHNLTRPDAEQPGSPEPTPAPTVTVTAQPSPAPAPTVTATPAPPTGDLYETPGFHYVNGRKWMTTCEPYSVTIRCWTYIWGTQVQYTGGQFVKVNGWLFNNLTYVAAPRSVWKDNKLAYDNSWTAADGRRWRTQCETALTGRNGCRSWAEATVIEPTGSGYALVKKFVFNNIVRFSN
ncbi:hypothetical protein EAX62_10000 [Tessaracoccus antarcticus]|uniref:GH18 domain-containing protein n=1 Tax=Tessaracoccus antarcticus TaxID=2479848 RepID=A0A3M0G7E4_9ACTN|nr:hypothetical protein EAX62_10000 [Tessaracoccus antarcticus]